MVVLHDAVLHSENPHENPRENGKVCSTVRIYRRIFCKERYMMQFLCRHENRLKIYER